MAMVQSLFTKGDQNVWSRSTIYYALFSEYVMHIYYGLKLESNAYPNGLGGNILLTITSLSTDGTDSTLTLSYYLATRKSWS